MPYVMLFFGTLYTRVAVGSVTAQAQLTSQLAQSATSTEGGVTNSTSEYMYLF